MKKTFALQYRRSNSIAILSGICLLLGCSTAPRDFETPTGPRPGDQFGPWEILGALGRNTCTLQQPNAHTGFSEDITVNVPPGTEIIVPAMRGWWFGYGSTVPDDFSAAPPQKWNAEDHNFGMSYINILPIDINAVDSTVTPPTQTAVISVIGNLSDDNGDDDWWSCVNYTLICLGKKKIP